MPVSYCSVLKVQSCDYLPGLKLCFMFCLSSREFTNHANHGVAEEEEWNKSLEDYSRKYPNEAREFKQLISGQLPDNWEEALPVRSLNNSHWTIF